MEAGVKRTMEKENTGTRENVVVVVVVVVVEEEEEEEEVASAIAKEVKS